jgi:hypothetical protein
MKHKLEFFFQQAENSFFFKTGSQTEFQTKSQTMTSEYLTNL